MVPVIRIDGVALVTSISRRRMASTSPIRADVPSMTSMMAPSCPSGLGPEYERPNSQYVIAARTAFTSAGVGAFGVEAGRRNRET